MVLIKFIGNIRSICKVNTFISNTLLISKHGELSEVLGPFCTEDPNIDKEEKREASL